MRPRPWHALAALLAASAASAQDRLVGLRAVGGGVTAEAITFGGDGLPQPAVAGQDSLRVRSVRQLSIPVTVAVPLGTAWTFDVTSIYVNGRVSYDAAGSPSGRRTATLQGVSDVRLRAVGRLAGDALVVTLGANAPTGRARLDGEQITAVRVLAAPTLALGSPPVGAGGSGTVGLLTAHGVGQWAVAGGVSYELHGSYAPIGALVAGAPTTDYRPGDVLRLSLGADGFAGRHRLSLSTTVDLFGTDELRATGSSAAALGTLASVRLGPVVTSDVQLQLAAPAVREATLWVSNRWRAAFQRDGATVAGSSGDFVDGGFRTTIPMARRTDLTLAVDGRWQSDLDFDDTILTAGGTAGGLTAGLAHRVGHVTLQPYARAQLGRVTSRAGASSTTMRGGSVGLTLLSRF